MRRLAHIHHKTNKVTEPLWHVQLALVIVIILQLILDSRLSAWPKFIIAGTELILLSILMFVALSAVNLRVRRTFAILLIALITVGNFISLALVIHSLVNQENAFTGAGLLVSAFSIFVTNIIVFGFWYWEMEFKRTDKPVDFLFPQENGPSYLGLHNTGWRPQFFDYLYLSLVNATSFSATDSVPLSHRAKALMSIQALISLSIVVLVTAKAVSIIG
jgi:hypothetical protein